MGRKPLSDARKSDTPLRIRLTAGEREQLDNAAEDAGLATSAWARELLLRAAERAAKKK